MLASSRCWSVAGPVRWPSSRTGSCQVANVTAPYHHTRYNDVVLTILQIRRRRLKGVLRRQELVDYGSVW